MRRFLNECTVFFREFQRSTLTTGSVVPSGRFLARAMTCHLRGTRRPARILEVGPGTGALTREIVRYLGPQDTLDLVEVNPQFVEVLRDRFLADWSFRRVRRQVRLIHAPLQRLRDSQPPYDLAISALPLNNFPPALVAELFDVFRQIMNPSGVLTYFEYMGVRRLRFRWSFGAERSRLAQLDAILQGNLAEYRFRQDAVFVNFPPAWVHHLSFGTPGASRAGREPSRYHRWRSDLSPPTESRG